MTYKELADALMTLEFCQHSPAVIEAAQALRDMPEGERIEGIIVEESRDLKTEKLWRERI